jgi:FlaA1/EpsC-like NDP-sugar epimerase
VPAPGRWRLRGVAAADVPEMPGRVCEVLSTFGVQAIYYAAAYKPVPIVEHNVIEAIHNNVISTTT